jgi:hypothetical protein
MYTAVPPYPLNKTTTTTATATAATHLLVEPPNHLLIAVQL